MCLQIWEFAGGCPQIGSRFVGGCPQISAPDYMVTARICDPSQVDTSAVYQRWGRATSCVDGTGSRVDNNVYRFLPTGNRLQEAGQPKKARNWTCRSSARSKSVRYPFTLHPNHPFSSELTSFRDAQTTPFRDAKMMYCVNLSNAEVTFIRIAYLGTPK